MDMKKNNSGSESSEDDDEDYVDPQALLRDPYLADIV